MNGKLGRLGDYDTILMMNLEENFSVKIVCRESRFLTGGNSRIIATHKHDQGAESNASNSDNQVIHVLYAKLSFSNYYI